MYDNSHETSSAAHNLYFHMVLFINPFAPENFAEKCILKLDKLFSGHCLAIKSLSLPQSPLQVGYFATVWSTCKILACKVHTCAENKTVFYGCTPQWLQCEPNFFKLLKWLPNSYYESTSFIEFAERLSLFFFSNEKDNERFWCQRKLFGQDIWISYSNLCLC